MKKINQRNYFVVIDDSEEMWTAVKFATKRAKSTKSNLTTISFIESISDGMMLTSSTEKILDKDDLCLTTMSPIWCGLCHWETACHPTSKALLSGLRLSTCPQLAMSQPFRS